MPTTSTSCISRAAAALAGALVGFLWYNSFPAQIFMGDTGSLSIGGVIAVFALCIRKELLLPLLCGVFLVESFSVMLQVGWFKYTKRKYGEGRRILLRLKETISRCATMSTGETLVSMVTWVRVARVRRSEVKNTLQQYQQELTNRLPHSKSRDSFGDECVKFKKDKDRDYVCYW